MTTLMGSGFLRRIKECCTGVGGFWNAAGVDVFWAGGKYMQLMEPARHIFF